MRDLVRQRFGESMRAVSLAMADAHDHLHGEGGWNHCDQDPCHSVCLLIGELALVLMEMQGGQN